ncbi:hypothetical protein NEOLEDRAFT_863050 [Neolentinus lepideus HHB14362 ss-1]|uniref:DUF1690-domain-containing protein n=1 Tax=Neolentinus lepideus HHB14362 ss-1 TaxID=1314782 RepID=A0A165USC7_9AGAM|nr:hypothetical protein NEOLEDRAFT_863050 [Neolentinus lepideus HHB14362 ss-1]
MGAGQSKSDEHVFHPETPIQFSSDVVNHLSDTLASPDTPPERQSTLDAHIRSRIQDELAHLREEEEHVREEIERALEKENLDRERGMAGDESGQVKTSTALLGDVDELRKQVERFHSKKDEEAFVAARTRGEAVAQCFKNNPTTPLDCWKHVGEFKASVAHVEERYIESLR